MSAMKESLRDRAYEQCVKEILSDKALPELAVKDKSALAIDNYPIKAILAPAAEKK